MGDVVSFPVTDDSPHLSGQARCLDCGHEWTAVAPVGTPVLDCPNCETNRGVWRGTMGASPGTMYTDEWTCHCGCDVFKVVAKDGIFKGIICLRCGKPQEF